jgi:hypothetical protein
MIIFNSLKLALDATGRIQKHNDPQESNILRGRQQRASIFIDFIGYFE